MVQEITLGLQEHGRAYKVRYVENRESRHHALIHSGKILRLLIKEYQASLASHRPISFITLTTAEKASVTADLGFTLPKYKKTFAGSEYLPILIHFMQ